MALAVPAQMTLAHQHLSHTASTNKCLKVCAHSRKIFCDTKYLKHLKKTLVPTHYTINTRSLLLLFTLLSFGCLLTSSQKALGIAASLGGGPVRALIPFFGVHLILRPLPPHRAHCRTVPIPEKRRVFFRALLIPAQPCFLEGLGRHGVGSLYGKEKGSC